MKILLIEDEIKTVQTLKQGLEENNIDIDFAYDGQMGKLLALRNQYDVIVSDIIMPLMNGLELCKQLRSSGVKAPILLLSALHSTEDKVAGFDAGADDYLAKPFEFIELIARIKALARRNTPNFTQNSQLVFADVILNVESRIVLRNGRKIELTPKEFALMEYFIRHQGRTISKSEIADNVWDINFDTGTNIIEVYVNYLRNKIDKGFEQKIIHTQFGQGYILKVEDAN
jgi:two-component system, OmpR family, copper resistance phosphate regulon response regulator CusR